MRGFRFLKKDKQNKKNSCEPVDSTEQFLTIEDRAVLTRVLNVHTCFGSEAKSIPNVTCLQFILHVWPCLHTLAANSE